MRTPRRPSIVASLVASALLLAGCDADPSPPDPEAPMPATDTTSLFDPAQLDSTWAVPLGRFVLEVPALLQPSRSPFRLAGLELERPTATYRLGGVSVEEFALAYVAEQAGLLPGAPPARVLDILWRRHVEDVRERLLDGLLPVDRGQGFEPILEERAEGEWFHAVRYADTPRDEVFSTWEALFVRGGVVVWLREETYTARGRDTVEPVYETLLQLAEAYRPRLQEGSDAGGGYTSGSHRPGTGAYRPPAQGAGGAAALAPASSGPGFHTRLGVFEVPFMHRESAGIGLFGPDRLPELFVDLHTFDKLIRPDAEERMAGVMSKVQEALLAIFGRGSRARALRNQPRALDVGGGHVLEGRELWVRLKEDNEEYRGTSYSFTWVDAGEPKTMQKPEFEVQMEAEAGRANEQALIALWEQVLGGLTLAEAP